jgi:hypothetical protein
VANELEAQESPGSDAWQYQQASPNGFSLTDVFKKN